MSNADTVRESAPPRLYENIPAWEKALRAIVFAGEIGCPASGLVLVARQALIDEGVPYEEKPI